MGRHLFGSRSRLRHAVQRGVRRCEGLWATYPPYWAPGIDESTLLTGLRHSFQVGAYLEDRQVGFCRVLTDCSRIAYLGDVFVEEKERGRGLGTALVRFALAHPTVKRCGRVLLGTRDAQTV